MSIVLDGTTGITTPGLTNTGTETLVNLTTTGNTTLGDASTDTLNVGNGGLIKDASGNVGIGVTPSAWRSTFKALQILGTATLSSNNNTTVYLGSNWYNNTSNQDVYTVTGAAGIYAISGGQHLWYNAPSGTAGSVATFTQAMTLDASGNLAVGISSGYRTAASYNAFALNGTTGSLIDLYANSTRVGGIAATSGQVTVSSITSIPLVFSTADTERARIDSSGRLIVGGSNINGRIQSITPASYTESSFRADSATAASTNWNHFYGTSSSNSVANIIIYGNGNIVNANNSYGSLSDVKIKENIVDATPKLADLMQVKVRSYNLKSDPLHKQLGVIAQELETVFPGLVDESPDYEQQIKTREVEVPAVAEVRDNEGNIITQAVEATTQTEKYTEQVALGTVTKSVKYSVFVPMLIKALQEQQALITTLTDRITALEARNV